jgi:membrane-associated phospholipid phosphatase
MCRVLFPAAALISLLPAPATAQDRSVKYDLEHVFRDAWFIVSAPTHATEADWKTAALLTGGVVATLLLDEPVRSAVRSDPESILRRVLSLFGESSPVNLYGRTKFLVPLSATLYGAGWAADSDDLKDAGLGCMTANLTTTVTRVLVSTVVGRARPSLERGAFSFELFGGFAQWPQRSFPGGHGANAFACTSFWANRFDLGIAEPALYAVAAGTSLARVADDAHWLSDSFAGMAYGYAVGKGVAGRYLQRAREREERSVQPTIYLVWRITF